MPAKYTFLPWLRQGIANNIIEEDTLGNLGSGSSLAVERPELTVKFKLNEQEIRKNIKLHGPGDIIGISKESIIREHPKSGTNDFESNCLAYIEFYEEDFPWRYTPANPVESQKRLRPWLFLIVAKEEEVTFSNDGAGLPVVTIKSEFADKVLPGPEEIWAWAHVHINGTLASSNISSSMTTLLEEDPDKAYARVMCPRRLERASGGVKYLAFLIPSFETGRLAGLGEDPQDVVAQKAAWTSGGVADSSIRPNDFPVYHYWEFSTGEFGDFEGLVKILQARPLGERFGKRAMNITKPGMGLDDKANSETLGLEGALKPPGFARSNWPNGPGDSDFSDSLRDLLNVSEDLQDSTGVGEISNPYHVEGDDTFYTNKVEDDPIVTPPLYGKWHALVEKAGDTGHGKEWVDELNLDPRNRAAASFATQTVRKHQEKFMEMAWQQIGEINEANQKIREAELARMVNNAIYEKHFAKQEPDELLMLTAAAQKYIIPTDEGITFEEKLTKSKIPNAARSAAFKKVIRPGRKSLRKMNKKGAVGSTNVPVQRNLMTNFNLDEADNVERALTAARKKVNPEMTVTAADISSAIEAFLEIQDNLTDEQEDMLLSADSRESQESFRDDFNSFTGYIHGLPQPAALPVLDGMVDFTGKLRTQISPLSTITDMVTPLIISGDQPIAQVKPIMAYPEIPDPMFLYLQEISQDLIIPNIREIPENTITLLENNQVFIESFMAGLNHEMSKELLWREYPTDQRGSYFRNFWDDKDSLSASVGDDANHDILPVHDWEGHLGEHNQRIINEEGTEETKKNFVVLVIRGDLLKKYPNTVIYAHKAAGQGQNLPRTLADPSLESNKRMPIFQGELEPDIAMFGFNLTSDDVKGNAQHPDGWFFILKERPGQINFGLDDSETLPANPAAVWNELEWGHLVDPDGSLDEINHISCQPIRATSNDPPWGRNAAEMASILYQNPVIFARHAEEMLPAT